MGGERTYGEPMISRIAFDSTFSFLREGYLFGHRRFQKLHADSFQTRLLGRPITIMRGVDAARFFYDDDRFTRTDGAMPISVVHSLQDEGSVQTLDGGAHRKRKERFTSILDPTGDAALVDAFDTEWRAALINWRGKTVEFLPEINKVLLNAVLTWLDLSVSARAREALTEQVAAMIDGAGSFGPRNWRGRYLRRFSEQWAKNAAQHVPVHERGRVNTLVREFDGETAAVELLNVVRPVVAVGRFIGFAVLALDESPAWRQEIAANPAAARNFAQEVRRLAPFFPVIAGKAREKSAFNGQTFSHGDWVMIDLFATNHDSRYWTDPWIFDPNRYERESVENIVAQGAGEIATTHRCPGEPATVDLLERSIQLFSDAYWALPNQTHRTDLTRFPANPGGRLQVTF